MKIKRGNKTIRELGYDKFLSKTLRKNPPPIYTDDDAGGDLGGRYPRPKVTSARDSFTIGSGETGVDYTLTFDGETNDGVVTWKEDEDYFETSDDILIPSGEYLYLRDTGIKISSAADGYMDLSADNSVRIGDGGTSNYTRFHEDGTMELVGRATVWDDIRIVPGSFDRPGVADPAMVVYNVNAGGVNTYLWEFAKNDIASFTIQLPHSYHEGENIYVHVHWTPGARGNEESGNTVGWKVDYSWANIDGSFPTMGTADLSDACAGTDHKHQMTPEVAITGTGKKASSILLCNIKRTDTGTDDTWDSTTSGQLPMILEIDFHFPINSLGTSERGHAGGKFISESASPSVSPSISPSASPST